MEETSKSPAPDSPLEVAAGLVFREGQLLITQRRPGDHLAGLWEFPGGKRLPTETFEECLRRELVEELDIEVHVGALLEDLLHAYPERTVRLRFYSCRLPAGEPRPVGCHALEWVSPEQLDRYTFPAADARLLARLKADRTLWDCGLGIADCGLPTFGDGTRS